MNGVNPNNYSKTKKDILQFVQVCKELDAHNIRGAIGISKAVTHRHLKVLCYDKMLIKIGSAPKTIYKIHPENTHYTIDEALYDENYYNEAREVLKNQLGEFYKESFLYEPDI